MRKKSEKPTELAPLPEPNLKDLACPYCKSRNLIRINSYQRMIKDLGTKNVRKFVEFESVHLKCKSCAATFPLERDEIMPGFSATRDVLETMLLLYFDFKNSAETVAQLMESLYSVELKRGIILKWVRTYGKNYCRKNQLIFQENFEEASGHFAMDGTFPKFDFDTALHAPSCTKEKKQRCLGCI